MSRFLTTPTIYPFQAADTGKWTWTVGEPLVFEVGPAASGHLITVEPGFTSDLGSIPWFARWLLNPANPRCARAYLLHDKINELTSHVLPHWLNGYSSQFAAACLYEALAIDGEPEFSRKAQFFGVAAWIGKREW